MTHDPLTGLLNRSGLQQNAEAEWQRATRGGGPLSLMMLDLDHFKAINDRYGHLVGDQALRHIATIIAHSKRLYDSAGRWGGEEFLVVLPRASLEETGRVAERLRAGVGADPLSLPDGQAVEMRVSVGVSSTSAGTAGSLTTLLQQADDALYQAKRLGRDRVCLYQAPQAAPDLASPTG